MALDQKRRQMRRAMPARTGHPVAVDHEDLVRNRGFRVETVKKILMVEPADAAAVSLQQPGLLQDEHAGAQPDQRNTGGGGGVDMPQRLVADRAIIADQPTDDDQIIIAAAVAQPCVRLDADAAAGPDRGLVMRQHRPVAQDRARLVGLVRGQPQHVHEIGKGGQREAVGQQETDAQPFAGRVGGVGHVAIIQSLWRIYSFLRRRSRLDLRQTPDSRRPGT